VPDARWAYRSVTRCAECPSIACTTSKGTPSDTSHAPVVCRREWNVRRSSSPATSTMSLNRRLTRSGLERLTLGSETREPSGRLVTPRRGTRKRFEPSTYKPFSQDTTRSGAYLSPSDFQATTSRALPDGSRLRWKYGHLVSRTNSEHAAVVRSSPTCHAEVAELADATDLFLSTRRETGEMYSLKVREPCHMATLSQARVTGRCRDLTGDILRGEEKVQLTRGESRSETKIRWDLCPVWVRVPPSAHSCCLS
jgi:hypothetical protein